MAKHQQEDPWAGFVDVLSNILMVVIFLVVILGISIFALAQQITKAAVDKAVKAEREAQTSPAPPTPPAPPPAPAAQPMAEAEQGSAGPYRAEKAARARQSDEIAGNSDLTIRSVKTEDTKAIEVASEEAAPSQGSVEVRSSQAFLTLKYQRGSFKIDEAAASEMKSFLAGASLPSSGKIEIRAFAQSTIGSVSEARRIAYYRAMQARSELIKSGIEASRLELKLRESASPEELDVVRIYAKPS